MIKGTIYNEDLKICFLYISKSKSVKKNVISWKSPIKTINKTINKQNLSAH